jgi:hypothetical protein
LIEKLNPVSQEMLLLSDSVIHDFYKFYGVTTGYAIFLFTAIECFINQMIPDNFFYVDKQTKKTETYNKQQIQEYLPFDIKLKTILNFATGKDFFKKDSEHTSRILNLKLFRNDIVHTKQTSGILKYDDLMKDKVDNAIQIH